MTYKDCWFKNSCKKSPESCSETCIKYSEVLYLLQSSKLPADKWHGVKLVVNAENIDYPKFIQLNNIKSNIVDHVENGDNFYIWSYKFGNGKTSWSIKLLLSYIAKIWAGNSFRTRAIFVSMSALIEMAKDNISANNPEFLELKQELLTSDLVVWDDVSATRLTPFAHDIIFNIVNSRYLAGKSNIFTGNLEAADLNSFVGQRLASRIWNDSITIELKNTDQRGIRNG